MTAQIFDTETTGKPKKYNAKINDLDNWPRVIQLAWQIADLQTGALIKEVKYLIKPDGWVVPSAADFMLKGMSEKEAVKEAKFWVDNKFTQEQNEREGRPMLEVLQEFIKDYEECAVLVAHNMSFDHNVLGAEMLRHKVKSTVILPKICTMEKCTDIVRLPGTYKGKYKWPKLIETFMFFFKKGFDGAHDAGNDVTACRLIFFELIRLKYLRF